MTIENLNSIIKDHKYSYPLYKFKGCRIGIDISIIINANISVLTSSAAEKLADPVLEDVDFDKINQTCLYMFRRYLTKLLQHGITPVFIFDGPRPEGKAITTQKRDTIKQNYIDNVVRLRNQLAPIPPHLRDPKLLKELVNNLKNVKRINSEMFKQYQNILFAIGIPWLVAQGEAEELGSALTRQGRIAAFISSDGDCVAHQCPLWIRKLNSDIYDETLGEKIVMVDMYVYNHLLIKLEVNSQQLTDVCIVSGCDYNEKINRFTGKTALKEIKKCGSYHNLPVGKKLEQLNYDYCLSIFTPKFVQIDEEKESLNIQKERLVDAREILSQYNLDSWIEELLYYYENIKVEYDYMLFNPFPPVFPGFTGIKYELLSYQKDRVQKMAEDKINGDENILMKLSQLSLEENYMRELENNSDVDIPDIFL